MINNNQDILIINFGIIDKYFFTNQIIEYPKTIQHMTVNVQNRCK